MPKDISYLFGHNGAIKVLFKTAKMKEKCRVALGIVGRHLGFHPNKCPNNFKSRRVGKV